MNRVPTIDLTDITERAGDNRVLDFSALVDRYNELAEAINHLQNYWERVDRVFEREVDAA